MKEEAINEVKFDKANEAGLDPAASLLVPAERFEDLNGDIFRAPSRTLSNAHSAAFRVVTSERACRVSTSEKITILHIDDHPVFRYGIETLINAQPDMALVGQASTGRQGIDCFRRQNADVVLMDLRLPDISGVETMTAIRAEFPDTRCIILTTFELDNDIRRALAEGAQSYMLKSMRPGELVDAIREVHAGKRKIPIQIAAKLAENYNEKALSDRELEVLRHLVDGNRNRDIAEKLYITEETVKAHMKNIMGKLRANDRTQALAIALRRGLIDL